MRFILEGVDKLCGEVIIPSSKSHSIRALFFAALSEGESTIFNLLDSDDTQAAINACNAFGAKISQRDSKTLVEGTGGKIIVNKGEIKTLNSGTTTSFAIAVAALGKQRFLVNGDHSIQRRIVQPLLNSINELGGSAESINKNGCPPVYVRGQIQGGQTIVECKSSQFVSALVLVMPLLSKGSRIVIHKICEEPYIKMTLDWLDRFKINYHSNLPDSIDIQGGQTYNAFEEIVPGDWSTGTFLILAGTLLANELVIKGLSFGDSQADKQVFDYFRNMGAEIERKEDKVIVKKSSLNGTILDLNNTPDAICAMAIAACFAKGRTIIKNVAHARMKETDRIKVMKEELSKMGANVEETADGLIIQGSNLHGCEDLDSYHDHRVAMALSIAGMACSGRTVIKHAESVGVTFPGFYQTMRQLGSKIIMEGC